MIDEIEFNASGRDCMHFYYSATSPSCTLSRAPLFVLCCAIVARLHRSCFSLCAMSSDSSPQIHQKLDFRDNTTLRIAHEATLHDLLSARNYAALQLLEERNALLRERYFALVLSSWHICDTLSLSANGGRNSAQPRLYTMTTNSSSRPTLLGFFLILLSPPPPPGLCHSELPGPPGHTTPWM